MQILIPQRTHERMHADIERVAPNAQFVVMRDDAAMSLGGKAVTVADTDIEVAWASRDLYVDLGGPVIREFMIAVLKSQNVRWFHSGGAGFDHPIFRAISEKGVALTNSDSGAVAMAEFVMASVLAHYQRVAERRQLQRDRGWEQLPFREIAGTTWLVIGFGSIGRNVAVRARAFGATVIGTRRQPRGDEPADEMIAPGETLAALPRADVVVLSAALNDSTRQLVNAGFLAAMKEGSVLVNVARGGIVDEAALLESLARGVPEHAVLDVFEEEPLPQASPFWNHPRVALTGHASAKGSGSDARGDAAFLENLARYVAGKPLERQVDPAEFG